MFDFGGELPIFTGNVRTSSSPLWCSLSCCAREEESGLGEWGERKKRPDARRERADGRDRRDRTARTCCSE